MHQVFISGEWWLFGTLPDSPEQALVYDRCFLAADDRVTEKMASAIAQLLANVHRQCILVERVIPDPAGLPCTLLGGLHVSAKQGTQGFKVFPATGATA
jgi:hypothetical protein